MIEDVQAGDTLRADISTVAFGGDGIARIGNLVAFVPYTVDGDVVDVTVREVKKNFIRCEVKEIIEPSPYRTGPPCRYYARCGGCQYQHIGYDHQLKIKEAQVRESFQRIGKMADPPLRNIMPSPAPYHYRGKAEFHCDPRQGKIGFMDVAGGTLVDIAECPLVDESINEELETLRSTMYDNDAPPLRERRCTLWSGTPYKAARFVMRLVSDRDFRIPYTGFFQANGPLTGGLVEQVLSRAKPSPSDVILDCYCGSGLFSLFLASRVKKIYGIEIDKKAIECAKHNFKYHGYTNGRFFRGSVIDILDSIFIRENISIDTIILDPPREGCSRQVLDRIFRLHPSRIIYASCNPATQARDITYLSEQEYSLKALQPIDMFPQTKHIEVIALLARNR